MWYLDPRQNQKTSVVGDESDVTPPRPTAPTNEVVPARQVPWRRAPRETSDGTSLGQNQILQVLAHRLLIAQVMMVLDQAVEQRLLRRAANLLKFDEPELTQLAADR